MNRWPGRAPLFVGHGGHRITRGAWQYRVLRAFKLAGPDAQRIPGALVHALRHTYAKELANTKAHATGRPVAVIDGSFLATAAVSAPDVMVKSVGTALDCFSDLPDEEREILFETFRVWQDSDASVSAVADRLYCHPNTVRHRLHRIENRTGRSLSRPRDLAELCLAFEVYRWLM